MSPNIEKMNKRTTAGSINTQTLLDFDLGESSDDSDFRIEDHDDESDDFSVNSSDQGSGGSDDDSDDDDDDDESDEDFTIVKNDSAQTNGGANVTGAPAAPQANLKEELDKATAKILATPICCVCLGERSDDTNEIVECDNCGISVHEGCYGISDSASISSTVSSCSTEPWFCESCKANIDSPVCELCPNRGGIFKETDVGKWVHLVCALYVPGVAFGEVDHLSSVTLFEMQYSKWGAKTCSLCDDARLTRCGVCIGCDAGMCKTYFHVTCAQAAGLLSETHSEEADHADPFYAHCKVHSDKTQIKRRKRNFYALKVKMEYRHANADQRKAEVSTPAQERIERKLKKHRNKYVSHKSMKSEPWVPTQKMPRLLSTSASACRRLIEKAELMGIDTAALEFQEAQVAALSDIRKKWHISPAFSVEFIGYYLDRITRSKEIKTNLQQQSDLNKQLALDQKNLREKYDETLRIQVDEINRRNELNETIEKLQAAIRSLCPNKSIVKFDSIGQTAPSVTPAVTTPPVSRPMSVPTAAALKMGVGFPLTNLSGTTDDSNRVLSTQCPAKTNLLNECGICKRCNDQHLLAKCDVCHLHYHLGCLNPPLTRHPKKSKSYAWQCSECDEDNPDGVPLTSGPRKSRTKYAKDGSIVPVDASFDFLLDDYKEENISNIETVYKQKSVKGQTNKADRTSQSSENAPMDVDISIEAPSETSSLETKSPTKKKKEKKIPATKPQEETPGTETEIPPTIAVPDVKPDVKPEEIANETVPVVNLLTININPVVTPSTNGNLESNSHEESSSHRKQKTKGNKKTKKEKGNEKSSKKSKNLLQTPSMKDGEESVPNDVLNPFTNGEAKVDGDCEHKHNRKRRKEKHRNKHGADGLRSPSKEHKKKRKRKNHDMENPNSAVSDDGVPKIKIKFKALPLPGETAAESHFFYVPADMVRPRELPRSRPVSVDSDELLSTPVLDASNNESASKLPPPPPPPKPILSQPIRSRRLSVLLSPAKVSPPPTKRPPPIPVTVSVTNQSPCKVTPVVELKCDVCHVIATSQELVRCDECKKYYHFGCLQPPLKKTPKRRGYHWHCAECDPTDKEDN